ncbi:MAG TPA: primosomal replication protein N [Burkholderiales bacterium]
MELNAVTLAGVLARLEPLRHTPAGLPLLQFSLAHKSHQIEAGYKRQVECEVNCVALGEVAMHLSRLKAGVAISATGFLNRKHRLSAQLVLHATATELLKETNHGNDEQSRPC